MKILLICPTTLDDRDQPIKYRKAHLPPLSLAILAALTPERHTVQVINDYVETIDFDAGYDLVGLTAATVQANRAYQIADEFRRRGVKVVIGGVHASSLPQDAKAHADAIVIGEAENIWADVLADAEGGRLKEYYKDADHPDLKKAIVPRWDCFNMNIYPRQIGSRRPMMPVYTTRGCPYGCRFCMVTNFYGRSYRTRPVSTVLSEIDGTGAKELFFVDDNITAVPDYSRELFQALEGRRLRWMSQASTTILKNPDLLERAAKAGCFALFLGMESLNKESLAGMDKSFNRVEHYEELLGRMRSAGITPFLSFIFGFDQDNEEQFETTVRFLKKNRVGLAIFWILTPIPGSEFYQEMEKENRIVSKRWSDYDGSHVVFQPKLWSAAELSDRYWKTFHSLYKPQSILRNMMWSTRFSKRPVETLFRGFFYQPYFLKKIRAREHPFAGGIGRVPDAPICQLPDRRSAASFCR